MKGNLTVCCVKNMLTMWIAILLLLLHLFFIVFMLFDEYLPVRCVSAALQRTVQYSDVIGNTIEGNFSLITLSLL